MKKQEVIKLIKYLEDHHPNLYHDVKRDDVYAFIDSIDWDNLNEVEFDYDILKLCHMFKESHLNYYISKSKILKLLKNKLLYQNGKIYLLYSQNKYYEVVEIEGIKAKDYYKKFSEMISYELEELIIPNFNTYSQSLYYHQMLGCNGNYLKLKIKKDNKTIDFSLKLKTKKELEKDASNKTSKLPSFKIEENILYFKYPISEFKEEVKKLVKDIKNEYKLKKIGYYILDLRDNYGGYSEYLNPFESFVKRNGLKGICLVNEGCNSAAIISIERFKNIGAVIIGSNCGGPLIHYGNIKHIEFNGGLITYSTKFFNLNKSGLNDLRVKLDIYVQNTIKDRENGYDRQLETALKYIKEQEKIKSI